MSRKIITKAQKIVIKIGSSSLASLKGGLDTAFIARIVGQIAELKEQGRSVLLVTSGAVAAGCAELELCSRPKELPLFQAAAAVGQVALLQVYRNLFNCYNIKIAQLLLTRDCLHDRQRFLHTRNTMYTLLEQGALPIINENDVVAVEELKLKMGDNDTLAAAVAQLVEADALILLSDVSGLYDRPPTQVGAKLISTVEEIDTQIESMAGGSESGVGTGGMSSKVNAAKAANLANIPLLLANAKEPNILIDLLAGKEVGTIFLPSGYKESSYRQWIAYGRNTDGCLFVDNGAEQAIKEKGSSLLPVGVYELRGEFLAGDTVGIINSQGQEFARGLTNFSSSEIKKIMGKKSQHLDDILGYHCSETVVHRNNLILI